MGEKTNQNVLQPHYIEVIIHNPLSEFGAYVTHRGRQKEVYGCKDRKQFILVLLLIHRWIIFRMGNCKLTVALPWIYISLITTIYLFNMPQSCHTRLSKLAFFNHSANV